MATVGQVHANPFNEFFEQRFRLMVMGYVGPHFPLLASATSAMDVVPPPPPPPPVSNSPPPESVLPSELFNNQGLKHFVIPTRSAGESTAEIRSVGERGDVHYYLTTEDSVIAKGIPRVEPFTAAPVKKRCSPGGCNPVRNRHAATANHSSPPEPPGSTSVFPTTEPGASGGRDFDFSYETTTFLGERYKTVAPLEMVVDLFQRSDRNSLRDFCCHENISNESEWVDLTNDQTTSGEDHWLGTHWAKGLTMT
ncbi:hypothetical protein BSKO_07471 [Bryopsis sp. KO-2023]|nr:hypothetical protein BSKO_07471 [Bryopsis sp. KO-2023]